jgi:short-subunit dehydrogenase
MKAVISGATRGIGRAIAEKLAKNNYNLVLMARNEEALKEFAETIKQPKIEIKTLAIDFSNSNFTSILEENKKILENTTLLVNNIGVYGVHNLEALTIKNTMQQLEINLMSAIGLTNQLLETFELQNIINIGSVMSLNASKEAITYSISKHAFKAWNDGLRESLREKRILVTAIYPAAVNTSSWDGIETDRNQMIQPEDIANCVENILSMNKNTLIEEIRISPRSFNP